MFLTTSPKLLKHSKNKQYDDTFGNGNNTLQSMRAKFVNCEILNLSGFLSESVTLVIVF